MAGTTAEEKSKSKNLQMIDPMKEQAVYAEGKTAFIEGKDRGYNPYRKSNKELAVTWVDGWDQAKKDYKAKGTRST
jgi:ribosome modulation factor